MKACFRQMPNRNRACQGLTVAELLVVMMIIAVLFSILGPVYTRIEDAAKRAACLNNLRQIGMGIFAYAGDNRGKIPYGPEAPPFTHPSNLYPSTGAPTSLISLRSGQPVALGLLIEQYLGNEPEVLFCPGADQPFAVQAELEKVGKSQAQCSYYYRHAGNTKLFDRGDPPRNPRLGALGNNRNGEPIKALVMDTIFIAPPKLESFNVISRSNHKGQYACVLYEGGHVLALPNTDDRFTIDASNYGQLRQSFGKILEAFEAADEEG